MSPSLRLTLVSVILIASAAYAVLVAQDPGVASAIASGYVALVLTIFVAVNLWKKDD